MTEDYQVQQQRPSALPYFALGGAAGATGGYFAAKKWNLGIPSTRYASFDDILKEKQDSFEALKTKVNDGSNEELKTAVTKVEEAKNKYRNDVAQYVSENIAWNEKVATEGNRLDTENKALKNKIENLKGTLEKDSEGKWTEVSQNKINEIKEWMKKAKAKAVNGEANEITTLRQLLDNQKEAEKALQEKAKAEGVEAHKIVKNLEKEVGEFKTSAWNGVKENAQKLRGVNKLWTAIAGGAILGILALLIRPKAKEE